MPEEPEWELQHREWQFKLRNRQSKELPKEFTESGTAYEREGQGVTDQWTPAPRETEADAAGDTTSLRRRLDRRLFLLVRAKGKLLLQHVFLLGMLLS